MRYIYHILFVLVLIALVYGRINMNPRYQTHVDMKDPYLEPVTEVYDTPTNPPVEPTEIEKPNDTKLFRVGEDVTCIYNGVFSWDNGDEFVKGVAIECKVITVADGVEDMSEYGLIIKPLTGLTHSVTTDRKTAGGPVPKLSGKTRETRRNV